MPREAPACGSRVTALNLLTLRSLRPLPALFPLTLTLLHYCAARGVQERNFALSGGREIGSISDTQFSRKIPVYIEVIALLRQRIGL